MSRRTMRPRRTSVALFTDGRLRVFVEAAMEGIITSRWSLGQSLVIGRWSLAIETVDYPDPRTTDDQRPTTAFYAGVTLKLISTAVDECVSAPTEMKSTPVSAYDRTFSRLIPPAHSSGIRRGCREQISTALRAASTLR